MKEFLVIFMLQQGQEMLVKRLNVGQAESFMRERCHEDDKQDAFVFIDEEMPGEDTYLYDKNNRSMILVRVK